MLCGVPQARMHYLEARLEATERKYAQQVRACWWHAWVVTERARVSNGSVDTSLVCCATQCEENEALEAQLQREMALTKQILDRRRGDMFQEALHSTAMSTAMSGTAPAAAGGTPSVVSVPMVDAAPPRPSLGADTRTSATDGVGGGGGGGGGDVAPPAYPPAEPTPPPVPPPPPKDDADDAAPVPSTGPTSPPQQHADAPLPSPPLTVTPVTGGHAAAASRSALWRQRSLGALSAISTASSDTDGGGGGRGGDRDGSFGRDSTPRPRHLNAAAFRNDGTPTSALGKSGFSEANTSASSQPSPRFGGRDPSDAELLHGIPKDVRVRLGMSRLLAAKVDADEYAQDEVASIDGRGRSGSVRSLVDAGAAVTPARQLVALYGGSTPGARAGGAGAVSYVAQAWLCVMCGCVAVWLCGCVAVWLCGCGCVAVAVWLWLCVCAMCVWLCVRGWVCWVTITRAGSHRLDA